MAAIRTAVVLMAVLLFVIGSANAGDNNNVFSPCSDTLVQKKDGFTFGIAFSTIDNFYYATGSSSSKVELSPCDSRLALSSGTSSAAVFRPKVDEISLLTINTSDTNSFNPATFGGYMVAFAGHKYAARSVPLFVADSSHIITSFTLVLEFDKGRLQNLYWKTDGCGSCTGKFVCYNKQACAIKVSECKMNGGSVDCSLGIQLAFSGTDKHYSVLNSWYEVNNLGQYSLYGLYSNLRNSLTSQYNKFF